MNKDANAELPSYEIGEPRMTFEEIAETMTERGYPMSRSTAQAIHQQAIEKLRRLLAEEVGG